MDNLLLLVVVLQGMALSVGVLVALVVAWREWQEQKREQARLHKEKQELDKLVGTTWQTGGAMAAQVEKEMAQEDRTARLQRRYAP